MIFPSQEKVAGQIHRAIDVFVRSEGQIRPHFFLTGPSGTGKSYLTKTIGEEYKLPFIDLNAAQLTSEGISGNSLSKALRPLRAHWDRLNIIFMDEFDKLFQSNGSETGAYRSDVQNEILHCLEAENVSIFTDYGKYDQIKVDNTLFVFGGSFSNAKMNTIKDLMDAGIRREFVGRVPLVFSTQAIPMSELRQALPKVELLKQYFELFNVTGPAKNKAINAIVQSMEEQNRQVDLGIRSLSAAIHSYFMGQ